jgi:hypothetical protein
MSDIEAINKCEPKVIKEPKSGDICLFWYSNGKGARIAKLDCVAWGKDKEGLYKDEQGNYFEFCEPYVGQMPPVFDDKEKL